MVTRRIHRAKQYWKMPAHTYVCPKFCQYPFHWSIDPSTRDVLTLNHVSRLRGILCIPISQPEHFCTNDIGQINFSGLVPRKYSFWLWRSGCNITAQQREETCHRNSFRTVTHNLEVDGVAVVIVWEERYHGVSWYHEEDVYDDKVILVMCLSIDCNTKTLRAAAARLACCNAFGV
jgi:hypothetical protein